MLSGNELRRTSLLQRAAAPLLLFVIVVLFYWKLVLSHRYSWLESPDLAYQVLPWLQFQAREWHLGRFPLWDPTGWFGLPLFGQGQPGAAYPLNWLLFSLPLKGGFLRQDFLHWYFVLIHYFASLSAYALCRSLHRSRPASIIGACVYALGGYVANTDWPQMLNGAVWTPLVFLFLFRAERGDKPWSSALLSGFFLGFAWLAGHHQMNLYASLAAAGLWGWLCFRKGNIDWKIARLACASLLLAFCASAFQTLPLAEYGRLALRWVGSPNDPLAFDQKVPYSVHEQYALKPENLLGIFLPGAATGSNPYVGTTACALAFLGFVLGWRTRQVRWLAALALAGCFFTLGGNSLFHGILYVLAPLVEKARVPAAATLLVSVGLAPLCAFAIDLLPQAKASVWPRRVAYTLACAAVLIISVTGYLKNLPELDSPILWTTVSAAGAAVLLLSMRRVPIPARLTAAAALALILLELPGGATYYLRDQTIPEQDRFLHPLTEHTDVAQFLQQRGGARVDYDDNLIPYNFGDWYGIDAFQASTASVLANVWGMDIFSPRGKNFFGVRYYLGRDAQNPQQIKRWESPNGITIFENPSAYPRVWSVHTASAVRSLSEARQKFSSEEFNPLEEAFVINSPAPALERCAPGSDDVKMQVHQPNHVQIAATLGCSGLVILTDSWFPGWRATVDGKPVGIQEVDGGVRGVVVELGMHVIDMKYRPWSVIIGCALTLLAAAVVVIVSWREKRAAAG